MGSTKQSPKTDEKTIFKCEKHREIISDKLQSFYEGNEFFDTVLIAGSNSVSIQAHRVVLCALSEYFLQIFRGIHTALNGNVVQLKEIEASTLKLVIDFMYSGEIELCLGTIEELLRAASFLKLKTLIDGCCELIESNIDYKNSLYWFRLAKELSLATLKAKSLECTYSHFESISKKEELLMLSKFELKDLLFNENPYGDFEEEVFLSMVAWINYDKPNRECLVFELLSLVRFWALTPKFIVENRKSVCKTAESYELICSWLQWHLSPETRPNDQSTYVLKPRKKPKLAVSTSIYNNLGIEIKTLNTEKNSWSIEIKRCLSYKKKSYATNVIEGKLIVVGGDDDGWKNTVECLDLHTFEWSILPPMINTPKQRCELVALKGYLCVFANGENNNNLFSMEMFNFSTFKWHDIQPIYKPSTSSQICAHNGVFYVLDFYNGYLQFYDAHSNKWTYRVIKKDSLKYFGLAAVEGFVYVFGGCYDKDRQYVKTVQRYDLTDDSWSEMAPLPYLQAISFIKTKVVENKIIASDSVNIAEYDLNTQIWNTLSPISASVWCGSFDICTLNV